MPRPKHTCHARGCDTSCPPRMFMCRKHWFMLPKRMQDQVWENYTPGQERWDGTASPTDEYLRVTREIIEWLAAKEGIDA